MSDLDALSLGRLRGSILSPEEQAALLARYQSGIEDRRFAASPYPPTNQRGQWLIGSNIPPGAMEGPGIGELPSSSMSRGQILNLNMQGLNTKPMIMQQPDPVLGGAFENAVPWWQR